MSNRNHTCGRGGFNFSNIQQEPKQKHEILVDYWN